ncbi:MAG: hypothetical protein GY708_16990 [Actinomycetia bacterium]|nr:hypothetical protein [Actinomycetes bacterium]
MHLEEATTTREAMSEEELEAIYSQPPEFDEELRAEIQADEIAFAIASLECGYPPPMRGGPDIFLEVRFELEEQFIAEHQDVFDRYAEDAG